MPEQHGEYASHTEDEREARKYHFLPRKSMLVLRKNSKDELPCSKVSEVSRFRVSMYVSDACKLLKL